MRFTAQDCDRRLFQVKEAYIRFPLVHYLNSVSSLYQSGCECSFRRIYNKMVSNVDIRRLHPSSWLCDMASD